MKNITTILTTLVLATLTTTAQANTKWYVETPGFFQYEQTHAICRTVPKMVGFTEQNFTKCDPLWPAGAPTHYTVVFTDGVSVWTEQERAIQNVYCGSGICKNTDGGYVGKAHPAKNGFVIPAGHYVHGDSEGVISVYRRGTGPMAETFPLWRIENPEGIATATTTRTAQALANAENEGFLDIDLYCNPRTQLCDYEGTQYSMDELFEVLPMAEIAATESDTHSCMDALCYTTEDEFIGLNPFFYE